MNGARTGVPAIVAAAALPAIVRIMRMPEKRERLAGFGAGPVHARPDESTAAVKSGIGLRAKVARDSGARLD